MEAGKKTSHVEEVFDGSPKKPIGNYLTNPIKIKSGKRSLDFELAKKIADQKTKESCSDPMLLAWYQGKTRDSVPKVECGSGPKPGWISRYLFHGQTTFIS